MRRITPVVVAALSLALVAPLSAARATADGELASLTARGAEPVVLTGAQIPDWSRAAAQGTPHPYPSGATDGVRDAHNGTFVIPPDTRTGVDPAQIVAYKWNGSSFSEIPVQVDQRFPYFLANGRSAFSFYSGTDQELTYQWDVESWKKTAGTCTTAYPAGQSAMVDPVPTLDDDDEIVFMASDIGPQAPTGAAAPLHTTSAPHVVTVTDPADPAATGYVYLYLKPGGSKFNAGNGYVNYTRDANADQWIDRDSFPTGSTEALGLGNTGYGPNIEGTVCDPDGTVRTSTDRFPRDGVTVSTRTYQWYASGRWMVRQMHITEPGKKFAYGADLIDRWKGRAFQQSPDSSISVVGFEDEQVNWEANSSLLGERAGPVRAIREVWGADSGTNVTKTETFYRDAVVYHYHLRVHPIPPDGLYTSWDYNAGVATKYFNAIHPEGVDIDGVNDDVGQVDQLPTGQGAFFDAPDPGFDLPLAPLRWEQVSGRDDTGSLVYVLELKGPTSATNPLVVPFYRDDKCFDDGTGDNPVARPWPGEAQSDPRLATYRALPCDQKQGAWGEHGVHFFATHDSDNAFVSPVPVDEVDAQQWQFAVPTSAPQAVGEPYANNVRAPLVATVVESGPQLGH